MAIAVGVDHDPAHAAGFARYGPNYAVPALFLSSFSSWFVGIAFAGIASVRSYPQRSCRLPAPIFSRAICTRSSSTPIAPRAQEATMAKIVSLVVKIGAVVFILALPHDYAIQLQLSAASGSSSFCPRSARALYALTQCASSSGGMGGRARRWNLHGGGAGLHIRGLFLVGVWNDVCSTLFGRGEFHARHRADAALQPSSATDCPIGADGGGRQAVGLCIGARGWRLSRHQPSTQGA